MHDVLRRIDLNLLLVFDALFRHRAVAAAADELALSASACSHALARLRGTLGDALFVRRGNGMQPTGRAEQLAPAVREALRALAASMEDFTAFEPATSDRVFTFAATDFTAFALLPPLVAGLQRVAPRLRVQVVYSSARESIEDLASGQVQFALGFGDDQAGPPAGLEAIDCFVDDYVVVARQGHPRIRKTLSLARYLAERHVVVTPWRHEESVIDAALLAAGLTRDVAVQLPSVMAAPFIVADSDYLLTLPRRAARQLAAAIPLLIRPVPFEAPRYRLRACFDPRHARSPAHRWMQARIAAAFAVPAAPARA